MAVLLSGHRVAERSAHPVENGCAEEEVTDIIGLAPEDLTDQVVGDVAVISGESPDELGGIVVLPHGQGGEL